jgi:hypothetical protein
MAFYYDHNVGDIIFSEHEHHGGGLQYPPIMRPIMNLMAEHYQIANALPQLLRRCLRALPRGERDARDARSPAEERLALRA